MFDIPEGATPISDEDRQELKIKTITTREELNRWEQENINKAYDWIQKKRNLNILEEAQLRELHRQMFGIVWGWAGRFRTSNMNIGVDWPQIPIALRQFLDNVEYWINNQTYAEPEIAARFHHGLVHIHLFPNGNGRHARLACDILMEKHFELEPFDWGENLDVTSEVRNRYISALRAADKGDFSKLYDYLNISSK
jgi:Fic-DOC domain mobile mystery protein B